MNDTQKMLQAIIINGQSTLKQELLSKIDKVDQKVDKLDVKLDRVENNLAAKLHEITHLGCVLTLHLGASAGSAQYIQNL